MSVLVPFLIAVTKYVTGSVVQLFPLIETFPSSERRETPKTKK